MLNITKESLEVSVIGIRTFDNGIEKQLTLCLSGDMSAADVRETLHYAARSTLEDRMCGIEGCARQILFDTGHDPERPGYFEEPPEHSRIALAHEILRRIGIFRCAAGKGDHNEAARQAAQIEHLATVHDFLADYASMIKRGRDFVNGPKNRRSDALGHAIIKAFSLLGLNTPAANLVEFLVKNKELEIEAGQVWISEKGREKKRAVKTLQNRIAKIRGQLTAEQNS